jgi:hypothetical protein
MKSDQLAYVLFLLLNTVLSVVIDDQLGHVQLLYQNDLQSNTSSTSALLIQTQKSYSDASRACAALSESLIPDVPGDVQDQLNYLVHVGQLQSSAQLYIRSQTASHRIRTAGSLASSCSAYDVGGKKVVGVDCGKTLQFLCTQSATPYHASQVGASVPEDKKITVSSGNYTITG